METISNFLRKQIKPDDPNQVWKRIQNQQLFLPIPSCDCTTTNTNCSTNDNATRPGQQQQQDSKTIYDDAPTPPPPAVEGRRAEKVTRIACMSDTHGLHRKVFVPPCDILIHAGDLTMAGEVHIVKDLADYFRELVQENRVGKVICIAGNHDLIFDPETFTKRRHWSSRFHEFVFEQNTSHEDEGKGEDTLNFDAMRSFKQSCIYLQDESHIHNNTIEFYGSPWTPRFGHAWAFMKDREHISEKWDAIPESLDVLITHGPPLGRGDKVFLGGSRAGCANLLTQIQTRIHPRVCVYGHVHEDAGVTFDGNTLYVNAANVSIRYKPQRACVVIDIPRDPKESARVVLPKCKLTGEEIIRWLEDHDYKEILPFFERCDPLLNGNELIGSLQPNFDVLLEKLKMNQRQQRGPLLSFAKMKKSKEELVRAILHLQSISYD